MANNTQRHFNEDFFAAMQDGGAGDPLFSLIAEQERDELLVDAILVLLGVAEVPDFEIPYTGDESVSIDRMWRAVSQTANNEEW